MVNWYYVQGTERMGPVSEDVLRNLFQTGEINMDSYVWKKGFANWERLKDVQELDFTTPKVAPKVEPKSPEITFNFDWNVVREDEEVFFIKTGKDRKDHENKIYGPYSKNELKDALLEKRINDHTLIYAAGMKGWTVVGETPLNKNKLRFNDDYSVEEAPLMMVLAHEPLPLIGLIDESGAKDCTLLGAGSFTPSQNILCSLYQGSKLQAKNIKMDILNYSAKEQKVQCKILDMDEKARNLIANYAH